jgi:hypothetical protein
VAFRLDDGVPVRPSHVGWAFVDDEAVLLDGATGEVHRLNGSAATVWSCLDGDGTIDELVADLAAAYDADATAVGADTVAVLGDLAARGLLGPATSRRRTRAPRRDTGLRIAVREQLERVDWTFSSPTYAGLDFTFRIRTNDTALGAHLARIFDPLGTDAEAGHTYSIVDRGEAVAERRRLATYLDDVRVNVSSARRYVLAFLPWHVNQQTVARVRSDELLLHAGAVAAGHRVVAFAAPPDAGKSTLVVRLLEEGFSYVTDEALAVSTRDSGVRPFPKAIALDFGSWALFPHLQPEVPDELLHDVPVKWHVDPRTVGQIAVGGELGAVVLPRYARDEPTQLTSVPPAELAVALLSNMFDATARPADAAHAAATIAERTPGYRLVTNGGPEDLEVLRPLIDP